MNVSARLVVLYCVASLGVCGVAFAAGPDLTPVSDALQWSTVVVALLLVAMNGLAVLVCVKGVMLVYRIVREGGRERYSDYDGEDDGTGL
jgi:hypothetical protein